MWKTFTLAGAGFLAIIVGVAPLAAQPTGRVIEAADGDVIVVPAAARVDIVRRQTTTGRLVYFPDTNTLVLIADLPSPDGSGVAMKRFSRWRLGSPWPLEPRWEGTLTIDDYLPAASGGGGTALRIDSGGVLIGGMGRSRHDTSGLTPVGVTALSTRIVTGGFDEIEQAWIKGGDDGLNGLTRGGVMGSMVSGMVGGLSGAPGPPLRPLNAPAGAVRVGGGVRVPTKLNQVPPVYPPQARDAGIQGVVILEVIVGVDGSVTDARVLRSIPLLDEAAVESVKQWRYEPTLLNGAPVPVIMTVTVNFTLGQ